MRVYYSAPSVPRAKIFGVSRRILVSRGFGFSGTMASPCEISRTLTYRYAFVHGREDSLLQPVPPGAELHHAEILQAPDHESPLILPEITLRANQTCGIRKRGKISLVRFFYQFLSLPLYTNFSPHPCFLSLAVFRATFVKILAAAPQREPPPERGPPPVFPPSAWKRSRAGSWWEGVKNSERITVIPQK